ncbi:MAG TPA: ABC transporter permease [Bacteroidia bacterium]|nr:ABC transporter permease [Bacteroidia bacterium]
MNFSFTENIRIALSAIRAQMLRAFLTILIIALGIGALVGILTAIDVMKGSLNSNFASMGANTFTIRNREFRIRVGRRGHKPKRFRDITYHEAMDFKDRFDFPSTVSVSTMASMTATLKYKSNKSNPNVQVFGTDENYLATSGYELAEGRNFSREECLGGAHVAIIGHDMVTTLFPDNEDPVGKEINVGAGTYIVIGTLKTKGTAMGFGGDKVAFLPLENVRQYFSRPDMTFSISVLARNSTMLDPTVSEATGLFRIIRKVRPGEDENFEITKSDSVAATLIDNLQYVTLGATIIGVITLLGAAIGLMNIMLVSVTERTREIGIRKAIGATSSTIRYQFLTEAIVICQLGGLFGIVLALIIGIGISFIMSASFVVPWLWIFLGLVICFLVGLISGFYPAAKASRLDPIDALRYE